MALRVGCEYPGNCGYKPETAGCSLFDCLLYKKPTTSMPAEFRVADGEPVAAMTAVDQLPKSASPMAPENMVVGVRREINNLNPL